jgi:hypothetical protein
MPSKTVRERDLYDNVARYLRNTVGCSDTAIDTGLQLGRIDVIGLRGIGGDLSGEAETIAVEVKAGRQPFATSAGQAHGYSVYAHRCYLADLRDGKQPFTGNEIDIASRLGIGLLALRLRGVREVLTAPRNEPIERLNLELLQRLAYARCTICGSLFRTGTTKMRRFSEVSRSTSRGAVLKAARQERGFVYWLEDPTIPSLHVDEKGYLYNRRYLCKDCVANLFGELVEAYEE